MVLTLSRYWQTPKILGIRSPEKNSFLYFTLCLLKSINEELNFTVIKLVIYVQ